MILPITKHPTQTLWKPSRDILDPTTTAIKKLIQDMDETMIDADGIGIAASQVGKNIRLFLVRTEDGYQAFINPTLVRPSLSSASYEEGCLSVPGHFGSVIRPKAVSVVYTDEHGKKQRLRAKGLFARVVQHEFDHIEGRLFLARAEHVHPPVKDPIPETKTLNPKP